MYPSQELIRLSHRKAALQRDIALGRARCAQAAARVARPLEWLDRVVAIWHRLPPMARFAAVPLGLLVRRLLFGRGKLLRTLARWGPPILGAAFAVGSAVRDRGGSKRRAGANGLRAAVR